MFYRASDGTLLKCHTNNVPKIQTCQSQRPTKAVVGSLTMFILILANYNVSVVLLFFLQKC